MSVITAFSVGKTRGLQEIATPQGLFTMCALDHRGTLRKMIDPNNPEAVSYETMVETKLLLCEILSRHASAVLLDPVYGAAQCVVGGKLLGQTGLLVSLEQSGYSGTNQRRITRIMEGWGVDKIKRLGASGVKLLVYYQPDLLDLAAQHRALIGEVADACEVYDIPLVVETLAYSISPTPRPSPEFAAELPRIVLQTAREVTALHIDVLKAEFPADVAYEKDEGKMLDLCQQLTDASRVPWVVLSAGVGYDQFRRQVEIACRAGASGYLAGRAVWQEALALPDMSARRRFLETTGVDRLKELGDIAARHASPWTRKLASRLPTPQQIPQEWHKRY